MSRNPSDTIRFLPVGLSVRGAPCLVVGGGSIGGRKAQTLLRGGAVVTVVAPTISTELTSLVEDGRIRWLAEPFCAGHVAGAFLVVAATNSEGVNASVMREASIAGALVCDASSAERSQVIFGALLHRDDATIAVFTDGHDPARARDLRNQIGNCLSDA